MSSERHVNHHPSESCTGACPGNQRGGLNIEALRLTERELLAKALWGYADYLETLWQGPDPQWEIRGLWLALLVDLEQANVKRPAAVL